MNWQGITALAIAAPLVLFPVSLTWYITGGGIISAIKNRRRAKLTETKACTIDTDCPEGYVCLSGRCIPQES